MTIITTADTDRTLVVSILHWHGALHATFSDGQKLDIRRLANGYGRAQFFAPPSTWSELAKDRFWDWSHVRDSTDTSIGQMAALARAFKITHECDLCEVHVSTRLERCADCMDTTKDLDLVFESNDLC